MEPGESERMAITVRPKRASTRSVFWNSSNPSVAAVKNGSVTALREGDAVITAAAGEEKAEIHIFVKLKAGSLTLNETSCRLRIGDSMRLTPAKYPGRETYSSVRFESSNPAAVTVDSAGTLTAVGKGTAEITAKAEGKLAYCTVEAVEVPQQVALGQKTVKLSVGQSVELPVTVTPAGADKRELQWSSSNPSVAEFEDGKLRALGAGNCVVTAKAGTNEVSCKVTVYRTALVVKISEKTLSLKTGETKKLDCIRMTPPNTVRDTPVWSSSNPAVARVGQAGLVTAIGPGNTWITVKTEIGEALCKVTVKE